MDLYSQIAPLAVFKALQLYGFTFDLLRYREQAYRYPHSKSISSFLNTWHKNINLQTSSIFHLPYVLNNPTSWTRLNFCYLSAYVTIKQLVNFLVPIEYYQKSSPLPILSGAGGYVRNFLYWFWYATRDALGDWLIQPFIASHLRSMVLGKDLSKEYNFWSLLFRSHPELRISEKVHILYSFTRSFSGQVFNHIFLQILPMKTSFEVTPEELEKEVQKYGVELDDELDDEFSPEERLRMLQLKALTNIRVKRIFAKGLSAYLASFSADWVSYPLETIKNRLDSNTSSATTFEYRRFDDPVHLSRTIYEEEGIAGFYRGWLISLTSIVPNLLFPGLFYLVAKLGIEFTPEEQIAQLYVSDSTPQ